jgi:hypothetical protein
MAQSQNLRTAVINFSNTGDNTVIAGVTGRVIKVYKFFFTSTAATNLTYYDGAGGTALSGTLDTQPDGGWWAEYDGTPYFVCSPGNAFVINQSGTSSIQGTVYYQLL